MIEPGGLTVAACCMTVIQVYHSVAGAAFKCTAEKREGGGSYGRGLRGIRVNSYFRIGFVPGIACLQAQISWHAQISTPEQPRALAQRQQNAAIRKRSTRATSSYSVQ